MNNVTINFAVVLFLFTGINAAVAENLTFTPVSQERGIALGQTTVQVLPTLDIVSRQGVLRESSVATRGLKTSGSPFIVVVGSTSCANCLIHRADIEQSAMVLNQSRLQVQTYFVYSFRAQPNFTRMLSDVEADSSVTRLIDKSSADTSSLASQLSVQAYPAVYVFGGDHHLLAIGNGLTDAQTFAQAIQAVLQQLDPP